MSRTDAPVVVVATPLTDAAHEVLGALGDRVDLRHRPDLLPPMRHPGDHAGDPDFERSAAAQAELDELVATAEILYGIPGESSDQLGRAVRSAPDLRWVQTMAAGGGAQVVGADLSAAELERVRFTTSAGVHGVPLAEFSVLGLLMGAKQVWRLQEQQAAHRWPQRVVAAPMTGRTVLLLGVGGIGREVARRCRALGMTVIGVNRSGTGSVDGVERMVAISDLVEAARDADDLVVTLPGTRLTDGLVDARVLAALRPGATVVNVGRGSVIDQQSLVDALRSERVGFAALDAFTTEPLPADSVWWSEPRVLVSPHSAALDQDEDVRIAQLFADNVDAYLAGRELANVVDPSAGY